MLKKLTIKTVLVMAFALTAILAPQAKADEQLLSLTGQFKQGNTNYIWGGYMLLDPYYKTIHGRIVDRFGAAYFKGSVTMNGNIITSIFFTKQYDKGNTTAVNYNFNRSGGFGLEGSYGVMGSNSAGWTTVKANYITTFSSVSKDY